MDIWALQTGVQLCFIRPGRPVESSFIESLNGRLRHECLNIEGFGNLEDARIKLARWREYYNHRRPHSALDDRPPASFARLHEPATRFALSTLNKANGKPGKGCAASADAALDPARRLPEDVSDQALLRIVQTQDSLLSLWSDFQARESAFRGP